MLFDRSMKFFKALGGGQLLKDSFISGFIFNPRAIANYKRAKATGSEQNFKGEGEIKGGLFIVGREKSGIAYQFIERNFGDWAPLAEVIDICSKLQVILFIFSNPILRFPSSRPSFFFNFNRLLFNLMQNQQQSQEESIKTSQQYE